MRPDVPDLPRALLDQEVRAICQRYRIDADAALQLLQRTFARYPDLVLAVSEGYPQQDVTRLSAYKKVIKETKKQVYYHLRRYKRDQEAQERLLAELEMLAAEEPSPAAVKALAAQLLLTHVSTQERAPYYALFYRRLFELMEPPRTIIDLGCGLHPLSYPFHEAVPRPDLYYALDQSRDATRLVTALAPYVRPTRLLVERKDLAEVVWDDYTEATVPVFDLAFLLKLVPVVQRLDAGVETRLASTPARYLLVTASAEALTRRETIRRREDRILQAFIERTQRPVIDVFEAGDEFGYLLGPRR